MVCQKCGLRLPENVGFCPSCGASVPQGQPAPPPVYQAPPAQQARQWPAPPQSAASGPAGNFGFMCPFCRYQGPPVIQQQVSSGGWILFVILLLFCLPLCWLPFVMDGCKDEIRKCASCGARLG